MHQAMTSSPKSGKPNAGNHASNQPQMGAILSYPIPKFHKPPFCMLTSISFASLNNIKQHQKKRLPGSP
jgi:hypothetical protein